MPPRCPPSEGKEDISLSRYFTDLFFRAVILRSSLSSSPLVVKGLSSLFPSARCIVGSSCPQVDPAFLNSLEQQHSFTLSIHPLPPSLR
ncbi:uncharacterized, partial [Tachysurus ichikawai]